MENILDFNEYSKYIKSQTKITIKEMEILFNKDDLESKLEFIKHFQYYIMQYTINIDKNMKSYFKCSCSLMDWVQDGNELLLKMLEHKQSYQDNFQLFTYFFYKTYKALYIINAFPGNYQRQVIYYIELINKCIEYYRENGRVININELSRLSGYSHKKIKGVLKGPVRLVKLDEKKYNNAYIINNEDSLYDEVVDRLCNDEMINYIFDSCDLTLKEKNIMKMRYCLLDEKYLGEGWVLPFSKIGEKYYVTSEAIRQQHAKILKKIRNNITDEYKKWL